MPQTKNFWESLTLAQMSQAQWEQLCDGCARCCLVKIEDDDTGRVFNTSVSCFLLDTDTCRCRDYAHRKTRAPQCTQLNLENLADMDWLPDTCAYRRLYQGRPLPEWHPLISGDSNAVHAAGVSVKWFAQSEAFVHPEQLHEFVIEE